MYVYLHAYMYVCMYACSLYVYVCMYVRMYVHTYCLRAEGVPIRQATHVCVTTIKYTLILIKDKTFDCECMYIHMYVCMYVHMTVCMYDVNL